SCAFPSFCLLFLLGKRVCSSAFRRQGSQAINLRACEPCRLKAELQTRFHRCFRASRRDINAPRKINHEETKNKKEDTGKNRRNLRVLRFRRFTPCSDGLRSTRCESCPALR